MATNIEPAVTGDEGDTRLLRLDGIADLDAATAVEAHVWNDATASVTLAGSVTDATARTVTIELGDSGGWLPTAGPDIYDFEVQVTFGSDIWTWPNNRPATIRVRAAE